MNASILLDYEIHSLSPPLYRDTPKNVRYEIVNRSTVCAHLHR